MNEIKNTDKCPCGNNKNLSNCCGKFLYSNELPNTPVELMRSRYTAFVLNELDYIKNTAVGKALERMEEDKSSESEKHLKWVKLNIINYNGSHNDNVGQVEFEAYFSLKGKISILHEKSNFKKINNKWFYIDGITNYTDYKIGRNDACLCGSNKKYKKCCGKN